MLPGAGDEGEAMPVKTTVGGGASAEDDGGAVGGGANGVYRPQACSLNAPELLIFWMRACRASFSSCGISVVAC